MGNIFVQAVTQKCSVKKVLLEILRNSQENTCARASFLISCRSQPATLLKRDSGTVGFLWILRNF